jgi:hypothetical protein
MTDSCEHGDEPWDSINDGKFLDQVADCSLLRCILIELSRLKEIRLEDELKNFGPLKCAFNNTSLSIHPKTVVS